MTPLLVWTGGAILAVLLAIALLRLPGRNALSLILLAGAAALALARQFAFSVALAFAAVSLWRGAGPRSRGGPSAGQVSEVETAWLAMILDHDSGEMDGTVQAGRLAGQALSGLSDADLAALRSDILAAGCAESRTLLDAYIERHRSRAEPGGDVPPREPSGEAMTAEEAYRILGLDPGASAEEVRDAYHRLIRKVHPDSGGSSALAALINAAREKLDPAG
jgi:hypothetical protein